MNFILKISLTNLLRRLYRSVVIIILIGIGVAGMMFMDSFFGGILNNMTESFIHSSGHIIVEQKKYKESDLFEDRLPGAKAMLEKIEGTPNVKIVVPRLINEGLLATASTSQFVRITGIDLDKEIRFGGLDRAVVEGVYGFGKSGNRVMIGSKLAEDLDLKVGKKMVITTQDATGEIASFGARVGGIIKTQNPLIDNLTVFISLERAETLFATPDTVTNFSIKVDDATHLSSIKEALQAKMDADVKVYTWGEYYPIVMQIKTTYDSFRVISYVIVFTIVAIGIFNIILISVLERLKEYGIMMALGTPFGNIRFQIVLESLILSLSGWVIGAVLGSLLLVYFGETGVSYGDAGDVLTHYGMGSAIYTDWKIGYVLNAFAAVIAATLISVWMPIRILKKRNPMTVLHFA